MTATSSRYCPMCQKAQKACICHLIATIDCDIPVIILQHPSETQKAIGTAKILSLSLTNSMLFVGENFSEHQPLNDILANTNRHYVVIYPSDQAISIKDWQLHNTYTDKIGLILIDGTWRKAYKIYQLSKNIQKLPCLALNAVEPSQYRIRKTSKATGLATVEAGFHALSQLTNDKQTFLPLMKTFVAMVNFQLQHLPHELVQARYTKQ